MAEMPPATVEVSNAVVQSTAVLSNSDDNPRMFAVGKFGSRQVLEDGLSLES